MVTKFLRSIAYFSIDCYFQRQEYYPIQEWLDISCEQTNISSIDEANFKALIT